MTTTSENIMPSTSSSSPEDHFQSESLAALKRLHQAGVELSFSSATSTSLSEQTSYLPADAETSPHHHTPSSTSSHASESSHSSETFSHPETSNEHDDLDTPEYSQATMRVYKKFLFELSYVPNAHTDQPIVKRVSFYAQSPYMAARKALKFIQSHTQFRVPKTFHIFFLGMDS